MNYKQKLVRRLVESFDELDEAAQAEVLDKIKYNNALSAAMEAAKTDTVTFGDLYSEAERRQATFNKSEGIGCGLRYFDDTTMGFRPGELTIIAAPPNIGKTTLALNILVNSAITALKKVLVISLEMTKEEVASRIFNIANKEYHDHIKENVVIQTDLSVSAGNIRHIIKREKPDLVMVDMLQMLADKERGSEYERVSAAVAKVKSVALDTSTPIILISHVAKTRSGKDGEATASDLKGSSEIEQRADIGIMINKTDFDSDDMVVYCFKHRTRRPSTFHKKCVIRVKGIKVLDDGEYYAF